VGVRVVEEDEVGAVALVHQVPILLGVDNGGKRSGVTLVGLCSCQRQAGEGEEEALRHEGDNPDNNGCRRGGDGGGDGGRGGHLGEGGVEGEEVCLVVLVIVISTLSFTVTILTLHLFHYLYC
jgi:hypothetical protein